MTTRSCQAVSDLVRYRFRIPPEARGKLELSEAVLYRRFRKQYSNFILETPSDYPVSDLGLAVTCLMIGKNPRSPAADLKQTKLRWNNYEIALLGQQPWTEAAYAFAETTKITQDMLTVM